MNPSGRCLCYLLVVKNGDRAWISIKESLSPLILTPISITFVNTWLRNGKTKQNKIKNLVLWYQLTFHPSLSSKYLFLFQISHSETILHLMRNYVVKYKKKLVQYLQKSLILRAMIKEGILISAWTLDS